MIELKVQIFILVMARVSAALVSVPALNEHGLPATARIGLAGLLSLIIMPAASGSFDRAVGGERLVASALAEVGIGLFIGIVVTTCFEAVAIACRVIETQAGFSLGSSIFAASGGAHSAFGAYYHALALVLFFVSGAYRVLLGGLAHTFAVMPVGRFVLVGAAMPRAAIEAGGHMFVAAVHFGAPVVVAILLADVALGLLGRAAPQMNVFAVGFPIKISVALAVSTATLAVFAATFSRELHAVLSAMFGRGM